MYNVKKTCFKSNQILYLDRMAKHVESKLSNLSPNSKMVFALTLLFLPPPPAPVIGAYVALLSYWSVDLPSPLCVRCVCVPK